MKPHLIGVSKQPDKVVFLENKIQILKKIMIEFRNGLEATTT